MSKAPDLFEQTWNKKTSMVRNSAFWRTIVSMPPRAPIPDASQAPKSNEIIINSSWTVAVQGNVATDGPARAGINDLTDLARHNFGLTIKTANKLKQTIIFELTQNQSDKNSSRWERAFQMEATPQKIHIRANSEEALLRASLYITNTWRLRRLPALDSGRRIIRPAIPIHIGADLWGGFNTTHAWISGRENDSNFIELARMGVNVVPIMTRLEDYIAAAPKGFQRLINPHAGKNLHRLAQLADRMAKHDIQLMLMAYNPRLAPDHPLFSENPSARGAMPHGRFRCLCSSDRPTREFLANAWAAIFQAIPHLAGMMTIVGGEAFYHCYMRTEGAKDCPQCKRRNASATVAEFINDVARAVRRKSKEALIVCWPYSGGIWSNDRDQVQLIRLLDPQNVMFLSEIDREAVDWRQAGYAKNIWDYSLSYVATSERCRNQSQMCRSKQMPFCCKIECNTSIECLNVPWLPVLENQRRIWENCRRLRPEAVMSRWLFDGSCKAPPEELGFWTIWGKDTHYGKLSQALKAIAQRDFGESSAPFVIRAWRFFSEAMRHHPQLAYYIGTYFIGPCQPLLLREENIQQLDPAFFGHFYWTQQENTHSGDKSMYAGQKPLFYSRPGWSAIARRGSNAGQDVALEELRTMARLWKRGVLELTKARPLVPNCCRARFKREWILSNYLALTWQSGANVEDFLRRREILRKFSKRGSLNCGYLKENLRDLRQMRQIAIEELRIARAALSLVRHADYLDTALRMDMGVAATTTMLQAKIKQISHLLKVEFPEREKEMRQW